MVLSHLVLHVCILYHGNAHEFESLSYMFFSVWVRLNTAAVTHFVFVSSLKLVLSLFFFRQLLLIGGADPLEDIQKFKSEG